MSKKRSIIFALVLLVIAATGYGFWVYRKKEPAKTPLTTEQRTEEETKLGIEYFTEDGVVSPVLAYDNLSIWYFSKQSGELLRQHLKNKEDLKSYPLPEHKPVSFALWPTSGSEFILGTSDGLFLYHSETEQLLPYPKQIKYIDWIVGGQRIAYVWADNRGSFLSVAEADNRNHETIAALPKPDFKVSVTPNGRSFVVYSSAEPRPIYFVTQGLGVLEPITERTQVLRGKVSPDGRLFAYATAGLDLFTLNIASKEVVNQGSLSGPDSFAWSGDSLYWSDKSSNLKKLSMLDNNIEIISDKVVQVQGLEVSQILPGTTEGEIFFVEAGSGRLGVIRY